MLFLIAIFSGMVAVFIGNWRHNCIYWQSNLPINCPLGWGRPLVRYGSLLVVLLTSLCAAWAGAKLLSSLYDSNYWWPVFMLILLLRWIISKSLGLIKAKREHRRIISSRL